MATTGIRPTSPRLQRARQALRVARNLLDASKRTLHEEQAFVDYERAREDVLAAKGHVPRDIRAKQRAMAERRKKPVWDWRSGTPNPRLSGRPRHRRHQS